jgi:hypothetical protein
MATLSPEKAYMRADGEGGATLQHPAPEIALRPFCGYPPCGRAFSATTRQYRFCSGECRTAYWLMAQRLGDQILNGDYSQIPAAQYGGAAQKTLILRTLLDAKGQWVSIRKRLPMLFWNTRRISDLRKKGHRIECRKYQGEYQYRLVEGK